MIRLHSRYAGCLFVLLTAAPAVVAAGPPPLSLSEVQRLAIEHQPLLQSQADQADAARQRAVSARQLPDPQLKLGVLGLPVDTGDAWRFNRDSFTTSQIGVVQEFPLAGKRALMGESASLKAAAADAQLAAMIRAVRRDAGLAYLDSLHPHHAEMLVQAQLAEAQRALDAAMIAYRAGTRPQSDVLMARAALAMLQDKQADYQQGTAVALEGLRRWIGEVPGFVPAEPDALEVPPLEALLASLSRHPELVAAARDVDRAEVDLRIARKSKHPDFNVELDYGYRGDFSDLVSLQVGIPLPMFAGKRQDRDIAAASADLDAQSAMREDLQRRLQADLSGMYREWEALGWRIDRYQANVLPPLAARVDATLAEYRSGAGPMSSVLDARQALLDAQLSFLELRLQRLRTALKLRYYVTE